MPQASATLCFKACEFMWLAPNFTIRCWQVKTCREILSGPNAVSTNGVFHLFLILPDSAFRHFGQVGQVSLWLAAGEKGEFGVLVQ